MLTLVKPYSIHLVNYNSRNTCQGIMQSSSNELVALKLAVQAILSLSVVWWMTSTLHCHCCSTVLLASVAPLQTSSVHIIITSLPFFFGLIASSRSRCAVEVLQIRIEHLYRSFKKHNG